MPNDSNPIDFNKANITPPVDQCVSCNSSFVTATFIIIRCVELKKVDLRSIPNIGIFEQRTKMAKNTSVTLGDHFERIIERSIQSGRYSSASEVIRAGLRMVDEKEQKIKLLREAIEAGERSGYMDDFDPNEHLEYLKSRVGK